MLYTLRDIVLEQLQRAREQPVDILLRPGIKAQGRGDHRASDGGRAGLAGRPFLRPQDARETLSRLQGHEGAGDRGIREAVVYAGV
jgi:hypothetical protein